MLRRLTVILGLALLGTVLPSAAAHATDPITCPPGQSPDPSTGICVIDVTGPGQPGPPPPGGGDPGTGPINVGTKPRCVFTFTGEPREVDCTTEAGYWSNALNCWVKAVTPPPADGPFWEGNYPKGAIYNCTYPPDFPGTNVWFWSLNPPAGPAAPPNPRALAQRAIAQMALRAVTIGIVPEPGAGRVGLIGMPTWMWAEAPGPNTMGPITRSASAGGWTVTATAKVDKVVWDMGDGSSVTCTGPGTPYADSYGKQDSPTCGHTYTRQGRYSVTATSYWTVSWSGIGQSGTIPLQFSRSATITMGESQVLTQ